MKKLFLLAVCFLSACATIDSKWVENAEGHTFEIWTGKTGDYRFVNVINPAKQWTGAYKGGKEKIPDRKKLMLSVAEKQASKLCNGKSFIQAEDSPYYEMMDKDDATFGGGLIGYAIASAASSDENIPVRALINFKCVDDK
jgi:hypothetical protein